MFTWTAWLYRSSVIVLVWFLACIPAPVVAQVEVGAWGGMNFSNVPYTRDAGLGIGAVGVYHIIPHWSAQFVGGLLFSAAQYRSDCISVPPTSERTFNTWIIPAEFWLRFRSSGDVTRGSFVAMGGFDGRYVMRQDIALSCASIGDTLVPGFSGVSVGAGVGVGFETSLFIADRGRIFGDYCFSWQLFGVRDGGEGLVYGAFRLGAAFVL